jgi:hypothetical protein
MSRILHAIGAKAVLAGAAALLATGATAASASTLAGAGAATPIPVDHQLCYTATAKGFSVPKDVRLVNQFSPKGFRPKIAATVLLCNPAIKVLPTGAVVPITNPRAHLACFTITAPLQPVHLVVVSNQFGQAPLTTGQPNLLCLPSWKSLSGPPRMKPAQPPGLSHFTCYQVKLASKAGFHPPPIKLRDEFAPRPVSVQVSPVPAELCLPTEKILPGQVFKIVNPVTHLLCFPVTPTPTRPRVFAQNQFGTAVVTIRHTSMLCVPSVKRIIH